MLRKCQTKGTGKENVNENLQRVFSTRHSPGDIIGRCSSREDFLQRIACDGEVGVPSSAGEPDTEEAIVRS